MGENGHRVLGLKRPHPSLFTYYGLRSLLLGPFFPLLLVPLTFRFRTLRYEFDEEGVSMRWGALFRREISLTYARLQDIHLASNAFERWLGLARVQLQTASGSAAAEMTIEGLREFEAVRDFLYQRMRGARGPEKTPAARPPTLEAHTAPEVGQLAEALEAVAAEMRSIRQLLEQQSDRGLSPEAEVPAAPRERAP